MYLICTSPRRRVLARLPLSRLPSRVREVIRRLGLFAQRSTSSHLSREEDMLDRAREDPDDEDLSKKTPWPRGGPRCCAQACLGRAFRFIENRLHFDMCHAVSRPGLFELFIAAQAPRTGRQAKSGSKRSHKEFHFVLAVWRNPSTGTFCVSEGVLLKVN